MFIIALCGSVGLAIMIWQRINTMKAVRKRIKNQFIIKLKWTGWKGETSQSSVINGNWILHPLLRKLTKNCKINVNQMLRMSINRFSWCSGYHICLKSFQNKNGKKKWGTDKKAVLFLEKRLVFCRVPQIFLTLPILKRL